MELEHDFTVGVPVEQAWEVLLDLQRVVPCMPGASLTSHEGDDFTGTVRVKIGPVTMTFAGQGRFVERDPQTRRMVIEASGKDRKGGGTARATIRAVLRDEGQVTGVGVHTDLVVTGRAAQFGRGMMADVSSRLLTQFTDCLAGQLGQAAVPPPAAVAEQGGEPGVEPAAGPGAVGPAEPAEAASATDSAATPTASGAPTSARVPVEAEPIDLLGVTGVRTAVGRLVPYVLVFVVGALVGAGLVAWLG
jgi:uncharacterized protein